MVVLILSFGLIPSLSVIITASNLSSLITNDLIAANLAQEGIEAVRAIRDANWFNGQAFDTELSANTYRVEWNSTSLISETGSNPPLKIDSNGLYNYTTGDDTIFRRRILIEKDTVDDTLPKCDCQLRVISEVTWPSKKTIKTVVVEAHLFDWK